MLDMDTFCMLCGDSHATARCPFEAENEGQLENEHWHKIARELAREEKELAYKEGARLSRHAARHQNED